MEKIILYCIMVLCFIRWNGDTTSEKLCKIGIQPWNRGIISEYQLQSTFTIYMWR